jgi:hypothetical protein
VTFFAAMGAEEVVHKSCPKGEQGVITFSGLGYSRSACSCFGVGEEASCRALSRTCSNRVFLPGVGRLAPIGIAGQSSDLLSPAKPPYRPLRRLPK